MRAGKRKKMGRVRAGGRPAVGQDGGMKRGGCVGAGTGGGGEKGSGDMRGERGRAAGDPNRPARATAVGQKRGREEEGGGAAMVGRWGEEDGEAEGSRRKRRVTLEQLWGLTPKTTQANTGESLQGQRVGAGPETARGGATLGGVAFTRAGGGGMSEARRGRKRGRKRDRERSDAAQKGGSGDSAEGEVVRKRRG